MKRKSLVVVVMVCLIGGALAAVPGLKKEWGNKAEHTVALPAPVVYNAEEQAALADMLQVYEKLAGMRTYSFEGTVQVTDPADSTANMTARVSYARSGDSVFYQLGESRMLSLPGLYIAVDDAVRKIFISAGDSNTGGQLSPLDIPRDSLLQLFSLEGYAVRASESGDLKTVRLLRENHITCKEYRLDYDTDFLIRRIFTRLTDFNDPLNKARDKQTIVTVNRWQPDVALPAMLDASAIVQMGNDGVKPAAGLEAYEIVMN